MSHVLTDNDAETYLAIGITPREIVRLRWPEITDSDADFLLWERTPFPIVDGIHDIADAIANLPTTDPRRTDAAESNGGSDA